MAGKAPITGDIGKAANQGFRIEGTPLPLLLIQKRCGITFLTCIQESIRIKEFVENYDRLRGTNLSLKGTAISLMVDEATGRLDSDLEGFIEFCWDIFQRLPLPRDTGADDGGTKP